MLTGKIESTKLSNNLKDFHVVFTDNLKYIFNHILQMDENQLFIKRTVRLT